MPTQIGISSDVDQAAINLIADVQGQDSLRIDLRSLDEALEEAKRSGNVGPCIEILERLANNQTLIAPKALFGPPLDKKERAEKLLKDLGEIIPKNI
jgi:hypothetical protein